MLILPYALRDREPVTLKLGRPIRLVGRIITPEAYDPWFAVQKPVIPSARTLANLARFTSAKVHKPDYFLISTPNGGSEPFHRIWGDTQGRRSVIDYPRAEAQVRQKVLDLSYSVETFSNRWAIVLTTHTGTMLRIETSYDRALEIRNRFNAGTLYLTPDGTDIDMSEAEPRIGETLPR